MEIFGQGLTDHLDTFMHHAYLSAIPGYYDDQITFGIILFSLLVGALALFIYKLVRYNPTQ